ncbi:hypothetical protein NZD89_02440 [Alicyclobacillus fastidiosus]|uniref:Uncharacterized protein n=1 Tax=Alicyclobacillus fastidiosus TaxID=392011 RepID=A0ABY6ZHK9_9BACL|nr:hypothetical protein [Alicyclobacillus fastidiosus]WAH42383.1 hypothetical protein NZD89_02440 [Alicyclobacillus fastidiosus]
MTTKHEDYFQGLRQQIFNEEQWDSQVFVTFNHEASSGKSRYMHELLSQVATTPPYHRALYVQLFAGEELANTVQSINQHAGMIVAAEFIGGDKKIKYKLQQASEIPVLCVTHEMYFQFCRGNYSNLWCGRDILVIDEFPSFMHPIAIGGDELGQFVLNSIRHQDFGMKYLADKLMNKFVELERVYEDYLTNDIPFVRFPELSGDLSRLEATMNLVDDSVNKTLMENIHHLIKNGGYFFEGKFHTYDFRLPPLMLRNNVVLDANSGFDYRPELSDQFQVKRQDKLFDYSSSSLIHYAVDTGKTALGTYTNFAAQVLKEISLEGCHGALFITDKQNEKEVVESILAHFKEYGNTLEQISENLGYPIAVDHFGNLTGVNKYRDFDTVLVLKTPNFNYMTYLLNHFYHTKQGRDNILFQDDEVQLVRRRMVAGEIYQSIHRICRDHIRPAKIYVFCNNQEVVDTIVSELPGVQYVKKELAVSLKKRKRNAKGNGKNQVPQVTQFQQLLLEYKMSGADSVSKKEVQEKLGIKDASNLNKLTRQSKSFLQEKVIVVEHYDFRLNLMAEAN